MSKQETTTKLKDIEKETRVLEETKKSSNQSLVEGERVQYTPSIAYSLIFPNGYTIYLNGILVNLIFDGRTYNFTPKVKKYVEKKLELIASKESKKKELFNNFNYESNKIGKV